MSRRIPLFPLPGVVLLPGTLLPLHIFEPRYRAMVADALAGSRTIGMAMLKAGWEIADENPAIHAIGGPGTTWADQGMDVSVSIGLATFPLDGLASASILLAADRACFVAKRTAKGLIATADEGLAIAREFSLQEPTPVDPPTPSAA